MQCHINDILIKYDCKVMKLMWHYFSLQYLNNVTKSTYNVASILISNNWHNIIAKFECLKWLPQPPRTNIIPIFGFIDPENIDIGTIINFLSILFAEIWDIEKSCQPFCKWLPQSPQTKYGWGPILKHVFMGHSSCVPNVMLVSQNARFFTKHPD